MAKNPILFLYQAPAVLEKTYAAHSRAFSKTAA